MLRTPLVGREAELAWLDERFARMLSTGEPQFVLVSGTLCVGKTRLVSEFRRRLQARGVPLRQACVRVHPLYAAPFDPLARILKLLSVGPAEVESLLAGAGYDALDCAHAAQMIALALGWEGADPAAVALPRPRIPGERSLAFRRLLEALARDQPLLLVVDEPSWADEDTAELLRFVARTAKACRLMIVVARVTFPVRDYPPAFEELKLQPLPPDAMRQVLRHVIGGAVDPRLEQAILDLAKDDCLHLIDLGRYIVALGARPVPEHVSLPDSHGRLMRELITSLPAAEQEVVAAASAAGERFSPALLERVLGRNVAAELAALERRGLLEVIGDEYCFPHSLVHLMAYHVATPATRARLNRRLGELFQSSDPARAARHFDLAGGESGLLDPVQNKRRASRNWLRVARQALARSALGKAQLFATWAGDGAAARRLNVEAIIRRLEALVDRGRYDDVEQLVRLEMSRDEESDDLAQRARSIARSTLQSIELGLIVGHMFARQGRGDEAVRVAREAQAHLARRTGEATRLLAARAAGLESAGLLMIEGESAETRAGAAMQALARGLSILDAVPAGAHASGRPAWRVRMELWNATGQARLEGGDYAAALEAFETALAASRRAGDRWWTARSLHHVAQARLEQRVFDTAIDAGLEALAGFEQIGDHAEAAAVLSDLGIAEAHRRRYEDAAGYLARSVRLYQELGRQDEARQSLRRLTNACMLGRKYDAALGAYQEWLSLLPDDESDERPLVLTQIGLIHLHHGDYPRALEHNEAALAIYGASENKTSTVDCLNNVITIRGDCGEYDQAELAYFKAQLLCLETKYVRGTWEAHWRAATVYADTEPDEALRAAHEAVEWARIAGQPFAETVARLALDEVELEAGGRLDPERVAETRALAERTGRPDITAWAYASEARALARSDHKDEALAALDGGRPVAESEACPFRFRLKFLLAEAEVGGSAEVAGRLCALAREKGARPLLARGLHLAGRPAAARELAERLGLKPLLARIPDSGAD